MPYQKGDVLQLQVLKNCRSWQFSNECQPLRARVVDVYSVTTSPVLEVAMLGPSNSKSSSTAAFAAVLKLYDRRFGPELRVDGNSTPIPHTAEREEAFQSYVRQKLGTEDQSERRLGKDHLNRTGKCEFAFWLRCKNDFQSETEAYERLKDLQGRTIPRMYAHVRVVSPTSNKPQELQDLPEADQYFDVNGIILSRINGWSLEDERIPRLAPPGSEKWQGIVQSVVDAVHEINKRGVIL
jgi:hypothetical protein